MFIRRKFDGLFIVLLVLGILTIASISHRSQLRADMPEEFVDAAPDQPPQKRANEERIARAYWNSLQTTIEHKYAAGSRYPLPIDPPAEFGIASDAGSAAAAPESRVRYWRKVREVWHRESSWKQVYGLDFSWMTHPVSSSARWLQDHVGRLAQI